MPQKQQVSQKRDPSSRYDGCTQEKSHTPAVNECIDDAILIPLRERRVADSAAETVDMKDQVAGAHHQLVGANGGQAAGTAASAKKTAKKTLNMNQIVYYNQQRFYFYLNMNITNHQGKIYFYYHQDILILLTDFIN